MSETTTTDRATLVVNTDLDDQAADALIARYVQQDRNRPGRDRARVVVGNTGVSVWDLIEHLRGGEGIAHAASDYGLPEDAVAAAVAYYARHRDLIDARP